jgi:acyl-CoA reductase-like NAD-dependent aldehyde dehydrogenase
VNEARAGERESSTASLATDAAAALVAAREAQPAWSAQPLRERLKWARRARHAMASRAAELAEAVTGPVRASRAETIAAEVLPLLDACRFLERRSVRLLAPRRLGLRARPLWLAGVHLEEHREPHGVVLVIGPSNYPLFLPGVQALQALVAGNAAVLKPGREGVAAARMLAEIFTAAGLDPRLCRVLPEEPEAARAAIEAGPDRVVLTGSAATGTAVLADLAQRLTPATLELSGCDAAIVRADADLDLVTRALAFGLRFNGSATCIAPRRVFVAEPLAAELEARLARVVSAIPPCRVEPRAAALALRLAAEALEAGARLVAGELRPREELAPLVLAGARPGMRLLEEDLFAPVLALVAVSGDEEAIAAERSCPYALGAAVFGNEAAARALARRLRAGCVVVNDLLAPTADPRLAFGGRGRSGYGVTRGAGGLLEMTALKVVAVRRGRQRLHFDPRLAGEEAAIQAYLSAVHGPSLARRAAAWPRLALEFLRAFRRWRRG